MKNWVCDGLVFFRGAADGLLCAGGRRTSRCGYSGAPVPRECGISPVKQSTTRLTIACLASVPRTCHVESDELPKLNNPKSKRSRQNIS